MIGATLDKYEVLQKVGEGGMATVYRGRHATLDRDVAIKVLHPHLSSSSRNRKRFAREARAIEHLRHDNILEIFDYSGLDASECYIITEFVEGDTITALLRSRGRLPSEVVAIIGLRLARALAYAHREGILHRDLKPDNVMLRVDGTVKLMDFGIARFLDESQVTMTGALVGSPAFMSPEQAREGKLDQRSDLFSLGTTLYYMVAGNLPFSGSNPSLILKNVIEANRPSVAEMCPSMSATLADVIERLMATNPDDRYNTADELVDALGAMLAESNVDPDDERWSLRAYLIDPEAYENRLTEHLRQVLLLRGKERLGAGDHLAALRLFNRLLAIDEDNAEVLALVQGLHDEPTGRVGGKSLLVVALVLAMIGSASYAWVLSQRAGRAEIPTPSPSIAAVPTSEPTPAPQALAVPEPTPEPVPEPAPVAPVHPRPANARTVSGPRPAPTPAPPLPVPVRPTEDAFGYLDVHVLNGWGDVYVDGRLQGRSTDATPIPVAPGAHQVVIKNPWSFPHQVNVEVGPGETVPLNHELQAKPQTVLFAASLDGRCTVSLDGNALGTVAMLAAGVEVTRPDLPHTIRAECPGDEAVERTYPHIDGRTVFPDPD